MTKEDLQGYRRRLLALAARLGHEVSDLQGVLRSAGGEADGEPLAPPGHHTDPGSHEAEEDLALCLLGNEAQILAEVRAALERIEHGTFGHCQECTRAIPRDRLRSVPYTRYCVACAGRHGAGTQP